MNGEEVQSLWEGLNTIRMSRNNYVSMTYCDLFTKTPTNPICKSQVVGSVPVPCLLDSSVDYVSVESYYDDGVVQQKKKNETARKFRQNELQNSPVLVNQVPMVTEFLCLSTLFLVPLPLNNNNYSFRVFLT